MKYKVFTYPISKMKKEAHKTTKILFLLLCLASLFGCRKDNNNDHRKTYLAIHRYGSGHTEYTYDDNGRLTGETYKKADGTTDMHLTYRQFNEAGMPERIDFDFPDNPSHKPYVIIEYDGNAKPVKVIQHATDGTSGPYDTYTYLTGRIEYRTFSVSGTEQYLRIYIMDNAGNLTSADFFNADNVSTWRLIFTGYDNKKALQHPYKYLAIALNETPNFFSVNNYTGYEAYNYSVLDARYSCTYTYNGDGYAKTRITTDLVSNISMEDVYESIKR